MADTEQLQKKFTYILAITDHKIRNKHVVSFVFSQLKNKDNWCLFFDNVDDFNVIKDFMQNNYESNNGRIIITTRNRNFKNIGIFPQCCAIDIPHLTVSEQKELFFKITYGNDKNSREKDLVKINSFLKKIPLMPLDVCAAAYYIKNTHVSFEEYLKISQNHDDNHEKMQSSFLIEGINYNKTRYGIVSSVFEKIIKINPDFKELLLFICLLDSQNIPISYLKKYKDQIIIQELAHNLRTRIMD